MSGLKGFPNVLLCLTDVTLQVRRLHLKKSQPKVPCSTRMHKTNGALEKSLEEMGGGTKYLEKMAGNTPEIDFMLGKRLHHLTEHSKQPCPHPMIKSQVNLQFNQIPQKDRPEREEHHCGTKTIYSFNSNFFSYF